MFINKNFHTLNIYGFNPYLSMLFTAITLLWFTSGSAKGPKQLLYYSGLARLSYVLSL